MYVCMYVCMYICKYTYCWAQPKYLPLQRPKKCKNNLQYYVYISRVKKNIINNVRTKLRFSFSLLTIF